MSVVEIVATDEFLAWYEALEEEDVEPVTRSVDRLAEVGVALGFPHSSAIAGSKHALRELRIQSGGKPLRVFYVFDPLRQAVLLIGGDKTGNKRFYDELVPQADRLYDTFLEEQREGKHPKAKEQS